jgi:hypothetical protein
VPTGVSAEQLVAEKLARFAGKRRGIVYALASRANVQVPAEVGRFFDAIDAGRWDEAQALFKTLDDLRNSPAGGGLAAYWRAIVETYGTAELTHEWPARKLLDYGNAVLESLPPGTIYLGGTDAGCFIPLLLNETGEGEPHIMLTQNFLTDSTYLDYFRFLYGDRMTPLAPEDVQRVLQEYTADARKRLAHDRSFPNEPRQVQPGEMISIDPESGKVQISGPVAAMLQNERLLMNLMQNNPTLSFALEESFPMKATYPEAVPMGPIMGLGATSQGALTADTAAQSILYWQDATRELLADPEASGSSDVLSAYAKMAQAQANLFMSHGLLTEAEQTLRLASQLAPADPGVVFNLVNLLLKQQRFADAMQVTASARRLAPDNQQFQTLDQQLQLIQSRK